MGGCLFLSAIAHGQGLWTTGYFPGYEQGGMPASNIDFTVVTHVIHFSVVPSSGGSLDSSGVSSTQSADLVSHAHAAGRKALICVGGAGTEGDFQLATTNANLTTFVSNLVNFVSARGYDGLDIDWEPFVSTTDLVQYTNFVFSLRAALNGLPQPKLLTVAAPAYADSTDPSKTAEFTMFASVQSQFDQINIMTYDLSGAYPGWVTWFNSPIFDGGYHFPSTGGLVPSVDGAVKNFTGHGVAAGKLGIGIAFYGWNWTGGTGTSTGGASQPRQSWTTPPSTSQPSYNTIISTFYQSNRYNWDTNAQAAYLSIVSTNSASDSFISYDDPRTCGSKVSYVRNNGLGGVMIWELAQDHHAGQADPLLESIGQAIATPGLTAIQLNGGDIQMSFAGAPLGSYRVEWSADLTSGVWNTLVVTNVTGPGGVIQVIDTGAATSQSSRFYRVQTPP